MADIQDEVRNMEARAGAITEGDEAGADPDPLKTVATHATTSTTARYVRGGLGKSRAVGRLRLRHRASRNQTSIRMENVGNASPTVGQPKRDFGQSDGSLRV